MFAYEKESCKYGKKGGTTIPFIQPRPFPGGGVFILPKKGVTRDVRTNSTYISRWSSQGV
ncbi:hypothetical protein BPJM79_10740 [Bacillus pumilus]